MVEIKTKNPEKVIQGRKNKQAGALWEKKVRDDLEGSGWIVTKWQNNIDFEKGQEIVKLEGPGKTFQFRPGKLVPAKHQYNPFRRSYSLGSGFPDFVGFKEGVTKTHYCGEDSDKQNRHYYDVIGIEAKANGYLDPKEREKCEWLLNNNIFQSILIAKKKKEGRRVVVEYIDFEEKYERN